MKTILIASLITFSATLSMAKDCATTPIKLRAVSKTASNITAKQWACAAVKQVSFEERDTNPLVSECTQASTLFREVGVDRSVACEVLLMTNGTRHFLQNTPVDLGWEPVYQSTIYSADEAN